MKPVIHYPRDGVTYVRGHCGAHSVSSSTNMGVVTCDKCKTLIKQQGIDMSKDNGGPAFPSGELTDHSGDIVTYAEPGMSVRDYFAAKAMQGLIEYSGQNLPPKTPDRLSAMAYEYADAMLAERAK